MNTNLNTANINVNWILNEEQITLMFLKFKKITKKGSKCSYLWKSNLQSTDKALSPNSSEAEIWVIITIYDWFDRFGHRVSSYQEFGLAWIRCKNNNVISSFLSFWSFQRLVQEEKFGPWAVCTTAFSMSEWCYCYAVNDVTKSPSGGAILQKRSVRGSDL